MTQATYDRALMLYYQLRPMAIEEYDQYILSRCPAELQADMYNILAPDLPKLMLSDTQQVPLKDAQDPPQALEGWIGTCRAETEFSGYIEVAQDPNNPPLGDGGLRPR